MVRLADLRPGQLLLDPMCGAGTILAERLSIDRSAPVLGGDLEQAALRAAYGNLFRLSPPMLVRWNAGRLPLRDESVPRIACNPPFGKQLGRPEEIASLYREVIAEADRVLEPGGRAVLLVSDVSALEPAARTRAWKRLQRIRLRVLGQPAFLTVWSKPR